MAGRVRFLSRSRSSLPLHLGSAVTVFISTTRSGCSRRVNSTLTLSRRRGPGHHRPGSSIDSVPGCYDLGDY